MGKPFWRSVEYFFSGNYSADEGNNNIVAIGFGGKIHALGGDDHITVGSVDAIVYTASGNDTVVGGSAVLRVEDTTGQLFVKGSAGYANIDKNGDGHVSFSGAAGAVSIDHLGHHGNVSYDGTAAYNGVKRKGVSGNVSYKGVGGYNALWHETNQGNLSFTGAGAGNKLDRTWFNQYKGSRGDVTFDGAGAANSISSRVESGSIIFRGAGADNHIIRKGKQGDITLQGAGTSNRIERTRQVDDIYIATHGNIRFEGMGAYNSIYSDVANGDIHFSGGGAYNTITRKGSGSGFDTQGVEYARAEDIVLTSGQMHGTSIDHNNTFHAVNAVKSEREPNTYLFAIADGTYTKINKIRLYNDTETNELKYYSEAWFKKGNHLSDLAHSDVSFSGGFESNPINGGYTLSNIKLEHQQSVTVHAVEKNLTEYEWVTYANGAVIDAKDVALSDAKMGGHAIYTDGTVVDVKAVKSHRKPNTYVYAKVLGPYTKIVVVELANDTATGALKYQARSWYKEGDHTANLANEDITSANGFHSMGKGGYSLSDLNYSVNVVRSTSETVADIDEYSDQTLFKSATDSGESSGDVRFHGAGGGNVIKSDVTHGNVYFNGSGIANVILHNSRYGNTEFNGSGAANVIIKSGEQGELNFRGAGSANVLVHKSQQGKMDVYAAGAVNVLVRIGDGQYLAHLLAYGNISVHKGNGSSRIVMFGGYNTHTQIGSGNGLWVATGGFNVMTQMGKGDVTSVATGGANVVTKLGNGALTAAALGGANVITHVGSDEVESNTAAVVLGGANLLTKTGKGNVLAVMGGGANVLTHVGDGTATGVMVGGANILTKVGNGDTTGIMFGIGNVLTHIGSGQTHGVMGAAGNIFTKIGDGTSIAAMIGAGNIFTHVGEGNALAVMGGFGNVFTKIGDGDALALMVAEANVFTHIGDGTSVALMLAKGNIATKVGNGPALAAMVGNANIYTHVGRGSTFGAMIGQANVMTKVGNDLTAALMLGKANIYTHVGDGTSIGLFAGEANVMTKVGNGTTLAAMFGKSNIMTHVGDGLTGVLALGEANIVTKIGDDFMGVVAAAKANVVTHVGDATTAALLAGKGNILTKVGQGTTVGLLISDVGNVMTHVGDGKTIGISKGKANIITKVGDGLGVNVGWGQANVFTQIGSGDRYNFAKGDANIITKVGDGEEITVVQGKANIITHVGDGDDYTGAWGKANVITKVGDGRNVLLAKGEANVVTQVGDGDSYNALWSKGNIVTKVGDGIQVTAAQGKANITTTVGHGLGVIVASGDTNINTKVGDGVSANVVWGKYNITNKVGDGLNVTVMKGKANANIHVGDGLSINASYAQNNVAIKIGNGDFYSLAVASSNTSSNKLASLFDNIKQTVLGVGGSQAINYLVQGDEGSSSGTRKGRGAIATPEITKLDGFQMAAIEEVSSDLGRRLTGSVTKVDTPDLNKMQHDLDLDVSSSQTSNRIVNGDVEQGDYGRQSELAIKSSPQANAISKHAAQNEASQNALLDRDHAQADSQRLEQEKKAQLDVVVGSQSQLESTDQQALASNGQVQYDAMKDESEEVIAELTKVAKGLNTLDGQAIYTGESGDQWRDLFADGLLGNIQSKLDGAKQLANDKIAGAKQIQANNNSKVKATVAKSEAGVAKGEQNRTGADQDIADAKDDIERRKVDAFAKSNEAKQAESDAYKASNAAQSRGERDVLNAENKATQAQTDAKQAKQNEGDRPDREGAIGSGLSANGYTVEAGNETGSHVDGQSKVYGDGRFSEGLNEDEQGAFEEAMNAVNRLQISAGIRQKYSSRTITSMFTEINTDSIVLPTSASQGENRKYIHLSGVKTDTPILSASENKELQALGEKQYAERGKQRENGDIASDGTQTHTKNYQSRDLVLEPISQSETIELGMPEIDQKALADVAERENVIIGVRPIDGKSKSLIASKMYSSKGLFVKAKSSDWGPMSGFIPVDQAFAKASARRDIEKFNRHAEQSIQSGNAVSADLYLNQGRVDELISKYQSLTPLELDPNSGMYKTTAINGEQVVTFLLNKVTVNGDDLWHVHYMKEGELAPFKVMGDPVSKQPMTADYDLLTVMYPYGDLGPQDKVKQPLNWEQWKESVTYEDLTPKYKELYDNEALYNKKDGPSLGNVSNRLKRLKSVINAGLERTNGLEMVHHGADDSNPYAVMADNFPATFFVPKSFFAQDGLGEGKGSIQHYFHVNEWGAVVIRSPQEFSNFQQVAINASYRASFNDKWNHGLEEPLFTTKRKLSHEFLNARDELIRRLSKETSQRLEALGPKRRPKLKLNIDSSMTPLERRKFEYERQGLLVASGSFGLVIRDPEDASVLIKDVGQGLEGAQAESQYFNQFYGEDSSQVYRDANGDVFLRMLKVPGVPVADLAPEDIPHNAREMFLKMVSDLTEANIYHKDLHLGNVMYDAASQRFWPIDFESAVDLSSGEQLKNHQADAVMFEKSLQKLAQQDRDGINPASAKTEDVSTWSRHTVTPAPEGGSTRFEAQLIIQLENDRVVGNAAANLAAKHPDNSVIVQLDDEGRYRVVYGDVSQLSGNLRWQLVGHGRNRSGSQNTHLSGYNPEALASALIKFNQEFGRSENLNVTPSYISVVGCSLVEEDSQRSFGHRFIKAMDTNGIQSDISLRSSDLAVDDSGRKHTLAENKKWVRKAKHHKVVLRWNEQGEAIASDELIRSGVAEGDINLSHIGASHLEQPARGAIGSNIQVFEAPKGHKVNTKAPVSSEGENKLSYSGNIQVNVGDGEYTAVNWGTSNLGIKVGTGGFKSLAFGDNNVMLHIGNGESKHSVDIGGYKALEGAQMFIGNRNVSFNLGQSNDLVVMMEKSMPTPPLVNPFDGAVRISDVLKSIAISGEGHDWLSAQQKQWTLSGAKKFVKDMSGLDLSSSVDYTTLVELDSQNQPSSRGLKYDTEAALNKRYNQWLSGNNSTANHTRADKFRNANQQLSFNFAVGGQGSDIQVTTGNWNFMFGDNVQSILDTNLGSLFGLMTQQFSSTGQARTTFTYNLQDLPRQIKNKLLGKWSGVGAETTLGDIFDVDYTASGQIVSRSGEDVDGVSILKEMLEVIGEFSGDQLQAFFDPAKLLDSLKSGLDMGADGMKSFAQTLGLREKSAEDENISSVFINGDNTDSAQGSTDTKVTESPTTQDRAFGFHSLNLPNVFATIFSSDKQNEMQSLVADLKNNLTADLLNMEEKTFDFFRSSGHLQDDGDINVSLGNYNFNWGGDGKDLGAYLGDNNNFWAGRGDDVFYAMGTSNIFTGGNGNDTGVLMGRENMMFGGDGHDTAVVAGRINHVFLGAGDDQSFVFGEGGDIETGSGLDYVVTTGNFNRVDTGSDQDYSVTIGNNNQVELGAGNDFANVFGNANRINASRGNDVVKLMGYHAVLNGDDGDDHLIAAAISKFSQFDGGAAHDVLVLGGYQNTFKGGTGVDTFMVSGDIIDNLVQDIRSEDNIVFDGVDWQKLWFERSGYDLKLSILRDSVGQSDQSKFEQIGSVTFNDYFNSNRAEIVVAMGEKDEVGEREYTALSEGSIDVLVQAMSGFEPQVGENGFIDGLDSQSQVTIATAWMGVNHKKGTIV
ncbi:hypothetical protein GCM10007938_31880 [Vibrio zhanjiangensis]|uniref:Peptidase C80 domain-containing protein n=1 Tax=Vibrio zhanjiangensis TaxID=1046128 RepID=A0ABQ6F3B8_9VIBR|nr:MARTX multifunctional-autoprocessing repeats-in-toxin holotoxin RtxA [Vibrio zhanjiangensis]GLT19406.1 hypothetical protein GCM10007938_31880 [Vibrio zhanjiangensis]